MHDPSKFKLGTTGSSAKELTEHPVDPAGFTAGLAVSLTMDGGLSIAKSGRRRIGISLGRSKSDHEKTALVRSGLRVPVLVENSFAVVLGNKVRFNDTTGMADTEGTLTEAIFVSGVLTGIKDDGSEAECALIDMPGGL